MVQRSSVPLVTVVPVSMMMSTLSALEEFPIKAAIKPSPTIASKVSSSSSSSSPPPSSSSSSSPSPPSLLSSSSSLPSS